ncbi:MAG: long-chain fatty acid--CoA ligase [Thaumarchaeota archaeon]|nr:long-chain fatty acid--CoA ligase [Nitrososphaerota archaeon]
MQTERLWYKSWPDYLAKEAAVPREPLHSVLTKTASTRGLAPCLRYQGRTMTYSQVDEVSSRFASSLVGLGVKKGDRVAIFSPNTPQFVFAYFGILKVGAVAVPCSPLYKERELEQQLRDSGSTIVVAANDVVRGNDLYSSLEKCRQRLSIRHVITASVTDYLPGIKRRLAGLAKVKDLRRRETHRFVELVEAARPLVEFAHIDPMEDLAVLQYTGGTTGTSKGAMLTHHNLLAAATIGAMSLPLTGADVSLAVLPLFHIFGMTACLNAPLLSGGRVVLLPRFELKEVMRTIQKERVTCFCGVPTMYVAINNHPEVAKFDLKTVRVAFSGGAALPVAVRKKFNALTGGNLVEGYGLTETAAVGSTNPFQGGLPKEGSIGIPFPSTDVRVVDLDDPSKVLATGEVGELEIQGPQVMKGYWNNPAETGLVLLDGWLLTGDIAKMDDDGYLYIVDRKKDMVDVGGLKVYPREVEEVLFESPLVKEAAVIGVPDEYRGESVKAFVVLKEGVPTEGAEAQLLAFCKERLANYKAPRTYAFVQDLPKTLVGKVLRRQLKEQATSR